MRHRLFVLVVSAAAIAACGDNTTTETIDARPADARFDVFVPPPPIDARPADVFTPDVFQADGVPPPPIDAPPPKPDAAPLPDGPPECPVPGGNSPACQNQAGAACDATGNAGTCTHITGPNIAPNCYMFTPSGCPVHQKCTPNTVAADIAALCTCDPAVAGTCVGTSPPLQCNADNTVVIACATDNTDEQCLFATPSEQCSTFKTCVTGQGCVCKPVDDVLAENHACARNGDLVCGTDVNNNDVVLVCTIDLFSECKVWKRQRSCSADGLLCKTLIPISPDPSDPPGDAACDCPTHTGTTFYSNPVATARAGFDSGPPCRAGGDCSVTPNGLRTPTFCSFAKLGQSVVAANGAGGGIAVASRLDNLAPGSQAATATFSTESFPLNAIDNGAVVITTDDDPLVGGAGLSTANAAAYIILFNSDATPTDLGRMPAVVLRANDSFRGMTITNMGRDGAAVDGIFIEEGETVQTVRVDSVIINGKDGLNRFFRGIGLLTAATGTLQKVNVDGASSGIVAPGPVTIANALVTNTDNGIVVGVATIQSSVVNDSVNFGIEVFTTADVTGTTVNRVTLTGADRACVLTGQQDATINWSGGGANHCDKGFLSLDTGNHLNISGGTIIDTTIEGVRVESSGHANLDGVMITAASIAGVHMLNTSALVATGGTTITGAGTGILLDDSSTANLTNTTVTLSDGDGIVINGNAVATLNNGAIVSLSGDNGVLIPVPLTLLPGVPPIPTPSLIANAGSMITMNTGGNGVDAQIGGVSLTTSTVTLNGADGLLISGHATLTSVTSTIDRNTGDGVHTTGDGAISITGGTIGTATLTADGNGKIGVHVVNAADPVLLTNVLVSRNKSAGVVLEGPTKIYSSGSNINNNQASGVIAAAGRIALKNGTVNGNTGTLTIGGNTLPASAGVAVSPVATVTIEGDPGQRVHVNSNGVGVLSAGNFAGINVEVGSNAIHGVVIISDIPNAITGVDRGFPQDVVDLGTAAEIAFEGTFATDNGFVNLHDAWLRNFLVHDNGAGAVGLPAGGITVFHTSHDPFANDTFRSSSFTMGVDTRPPSGSFIRDNTGTGLSIGGGAATPASLANPDSFCAVLSSIPPFNQFPFVSCGPVDATVQDTYIFRNDRGVVFQNGGPTGLATAVHFTRNFVFSNDTQGVLVRPSVFVRGLNITGNDSDLRFNRNQITQNDPSNNTAGAEIEFDATAFVGAPAPVSPFPWTIGDATLPLDFNCGTNTNFILGYLCVPTGHVALRARNNASVKAESVTWQRSPVVNPNDVNQVNNGTADVDPACPGFNASCDLPPLPSEN